MRFGALLIVLTEPEPSSVIGGGTGNAIKAEGVCRLVLPCGGGGGGGWHKASVLGCLPLAVPIGLSPLLILTLSGSKRVLVVSMEPLDDLSCLTTPGSAVPEMGCSPCR